MSKSELRVKTNRGWFGSKEPKGDAVDHHEGMDKIEFYTRDQISRRLDTKTTFIGKVTGFKFEVKEHEIPGDSHGVTICKWKEVPSQAFKDAVIWATVGAATAIAAGAIGWTGVGIGVVAAVACIARREAIEKLVAAERSYEGMFCTETGDMLPENQADKIKKLNKNQIKDKLKEIDDLLNDHKIDKFDTDAAKEKLERLSQEHKNIFSNENKTKFNQLMQKQRDKNTEYMNVILEETKKTSNLLDVGFKKVDQFFKQASQDVQNKHTALVMKIDEMYNKILETSSETNKQFDNEAIDSQRQHSVLVQNENAIQKQLHTLGANNMQKLKEANSHMGQIYSDTQAQLNILADEIVRSRNIADQQFKQAACERYDAFMKKANTFKLLKEQYTNINKAMHKGFLDEQDDMARMHEEIMKSIFALNNNVLISRENFKKKVDNTMHEKQKFYHEQVGLLRDLQASQQQEFKRAIDDRQKQYIQLEQKIQESRAVAELKFEKASKECDEMHQKTTQHMQNITNEVLRSRAEADQRFKEAADACEAIYQKIAQDIQSVEGEVLESRKLANEQFEKALKENNMLFNQTAEQLGVTQEKLDQLRVECKVNFAKAKEHMIAVYQSTESKLSEFNSNVDCLREEYEAKFKSAEDARNKAYDETERKVKAANSDVTRIMKECYANFKAKERDINDIDKKSENILDTILAGSLINNIDLQTLVAYRTNAKKLISLIEECKHVDMLKVISAQPSKLELDQQNAAQSQIKTSYQRFLSSNIPQDKENLLRQTIDLSLKHCMTLGQKYNFETDIFSLKALLTEEVHLKFKHFREEILGKTNAIVTEDTKPAQYDYVEEPKLVDLLQMKQLIDNLIENNAAIEQLNKDLKIEKQDLLNILNELSSQVDNAGHLGTHEVGRDFVGGVQYVHQQN